MCLAIVKPAGETIPKRHLANGFETNDDGAGMAWFEDGKIHIIKGIFNFDKFYEEYIKHEQQPMLVHFRWATHGSKDKDNCHPFAMCDGKFAMIHNGVIQIKTKKNMSDTATFASLVLGPMLEDGVAVDKPAFIFLVEQAIGAGNKIAVMNNEGSVMIFNEDEGVYDGKVWYSNASFRHSKQEIEDFIHEYYYERRAAAASHAAGFAAGTSNDNNTERPAVDLNDNKSKEDERGKSAAASAAIILGQECAYPPATGKYPPNTPAGTVSHGPVFNAKTELEIEYLMEELKMTRDQCIQYLDLDETDHECFVA